MSLHSFMKEIAHNSILLLKSDRSYRSEGGRWGWLRGDRQGISSADLWTEAPVVSASWPGTHFKEEQHSKEKERCVQRLCGRDEPSVIEKQWEDNCG